MGTRPPLCNCVSLGFFLIKLKYTNVYMFFLCVIYPRFVLIKKKKIIEMIHFWIYIYIYFFFGSRKHTGFRLFGCHFENEKGKFFSVQYNCDGLLSMWLLKNVFRYIELIFSWSQKCFLVTYAFVVPKTKTYIEFFLENIFRQKKHNINFC